MDTDNFYTIQIYFKYKVQEDKSNTLYSFNLTSKTSDTISLDKIRNTNIIEKKLERIEAPKLEDSATSPEFQKDQEMQAAQKIQQQFKRRNKLKKTKTELEESIQNYFLYLWKSELEGKKKIKIPLTNNYINYDILKKLDTINSYSSDKDKPYIVTYKNNIKELLNGKEETNFSINNILTNIVKNNIEYGVLIEELFLFNIDTHDDSQRSIINFKKKFVNIIFELLKNNNNENNIYDETNNSQQYYHYRQEKPLNLNNETTKKEIYLKYYKYFFNKQQLKKINNIKDEKKKKENILKIINLNTKLSNIIITYYNIYKFLELYMSDDSIIKLDEHTNIYNYNIIKKTIDKFKTPKDYLLKITNFQPIENDFNKVIDKNTITYYFYIDFEEITIADTIEFKVNIINTLTNNDEYNEITPIKDHTEDKESDDKYKNYNTKLFFDDTKLVDKNIKFNKKLDFNKVITHFNKNKAINKLFKKYNNEKIIFIDENIYNYYNNNDKFKKDDQDDQDINKQLEIITKIFFNKNYTKNNLLYFNNKFLVIKNYNIIKNTGESKNFNFITNEDKRYIKNVTDSDTEYYNNSYEIKLDLECYFLNSKDEKIKFSNLIKSNFKCNSRANILDDLLKKMFENHTNYFNNLITNESKDKETETEKDKDKDEESKEKDEDEEFNKAESKYDPVSSITGGNKKKNAKLKQMKYKFMNKKNNTLKNKYILKKFNTLKIKKLINYYLNN